MGRLGVAAFGEQQRRLRVTVVERGCVGRVRVRSQPRLTPAQDMTIDQWSMDLTMLD